MASDSQGNLLIKRPQMVGKQLQIQAVGEEDGYIDFDSDYEGAMIYAKK